MARPKKPRPPKKLLTSWIRLSGRVKLLSFVAVFAVAGSAFLIYAHADSGPYHLCPGWGGDYCATPTGNADKYGVDLVTTNMFGSGPNPLRWVKAPSGTVRSGWPFTNSTWNSKYAARTVYRIQLNENPLNCAGIRQSGSVFYVTTASCSLGQGVLWVQSGNWLVNVFATNHTSGGATRKIMSGSYSSSTKVYAASPGDWSTPNQNWAFVP